MSAWDLYWLLKLDTIQGFFCGFSVLFGIVWLIVFTLYSCNCFETEEGKKGAKVLIKWSIVVIIITTIFAILIPSTKQMATIIVVPKVITAVENNEALMSLPNDVAKLASEWVNELRPKHDTLTTGE